MTESTTVNVAEENAGQPAGSKLTGRVALVTGGIRGIGAAISEELASQGATIAAGFSGNVERAEQFAKDFADRFGTSVSTHRGNVASPDDCRRVVNEVIEQHGRLDILINNAGITIDKTMLKLTDDDWHKVLDVNLSGAFFLSQAALGAHGGARQRPDHQCQLDHRRDRQYRPGQLRGVQVRALRADQDVRPGSRLPARTRRASSTMTASASPSTPSRPGYTWTEMVAAVPEKVLDKLKAQIPLRRFGRPEEVARVVHSSPLTRPPTSPARCGASTAAWTCSQRSDSLFALFASKSAELVAATHVHVAFWRSAHVANHADRTQRTFT